ncbi:MAG TPA: glycosyltransferase [Solirubrobacterales bacterium]|nr:glycosyltransferase [Solirubrobacterales bacterium]
MRILRLIPTIDAAAGGPSTSIVNSVVAESRTGLDVTVVCAGDSHASGINERAMSAMLGAGVEVLEFPRLKRSAKAQTWGLSPRLSVWTIRNLRRFDVVHLNYVWCFTTILGSILGRLHGKPVVLTPHESLTSFDVEVTSGNPVKRFLKKLLRRIILANVDTVIYASSMESLDSRDVPHTSRQIYHPVIDITPMGTFSEPGDAEFCLGFLGRIHPKKNLGLIIETLAALNEEQPVRPFRLLVAGGGDAGLERELRALAEELGVGSQITWLGFVDGSGREELFRGIHVLLMPSRYESFGMSAAESMAVGVPPIVSRRTGVASLVEEFDAGIILPEPTVENLAGAVREMAADPQLRAGYRDRSLIAVNERLSFRVYGIQIKRLYEELDGRLGR